MSSKEKIQEQDQTIADLFGLAILNAKSDRESILEILPEVDKDEVLELAKLIETLQKSNEQIIKIAIAKLQADVKISITKVKEESEEAIDLDKDEKKKIYNEIRKETKKNKNKKDKE